MPNVVGCRVVETAGEYCAKKDDAAKPNVVDCRVVVTAGEYCAKKVETYWIIIIKLETTENNDNLIEEGSKKRQDDLLDNNNIKNIKILHEHTLHLSSSGASQ